MSLGSQSEFDLLSLLFLNTAWVNIGNAGGLLGSTVAGSFFIALHTANPGQAGNQSTSEAAYSGYARVAVARSGSGWMLSGSDPTTSANVSATTYPTSASGPETESYFSIGTLSTGAGEYLWFGPLVTPLVVNIGITPSFASGQLTASMT